MSINHEEGDRIYCDLCGFSLTTLEKVAYTLQSATVKALGLGEPPGPVCGDCEEVPPREVSPLTSGITRRD